MPPANAYLTIERNELGNEYLELMNSLLAAKRGTLGALKCSELYRSIYVRGYEDMFMAKNVAVYLTKEAGLAQGPSKIQVCFVDRAREPSYMPPSIYTDGKRMYGSADDLPDGVFGQICDGFPTLYADTTHLPVDLLKLLQRKGAMAENVDLLAMVNTADQTGFSTAQIVDGFKARFLAKEIKVFYVQKNSVSSGTWHHWIEYADVGVAGEGYRPADEYPNYYLFMGEQCSSGDARALQAHIRAFAKGGGSCQKVAGAVGRTAKEYPECKCQDTGHAVFCGGEEVAARKFNVESVLSLRACGEDTAYCSSKACRPYVQRP